MLIDGNVFVDDRGKLLFVNEFNFSGVKRFYTVTNHRRGFIRAWHGHNNEEKYVFVPQGTALVGIVSLNDFDDVNKFILSSSQPRILHIPKGYANGFQTLEENTIVQFFSTSTLEESKGDDIRFHYELVDIWKEDFR